MFKSLYICLFPTEFLYQSCIQIPLPVLPVGLVLTVQLPASGPTLLTGCTSAAWE
jgi:hypothetical protein